MSQQALPPVYDGLAPEKVWAHFHALTQIPRCSGNEAGVSAYVEKIARERGAEVEHDDVGNVLVRVRSDRPGAVVCLQGHMDMVCVADDEVDFNFLTDAIQVVRDGDKLTASGTTLGADNGIGVAYGLAMLDEETGPLEILCTVDEEVGLIGASNLRAEWLRSKLLLNLDSEEEDFVTIACAGGRDLVLYLPWKKAPGVEGPFFDLRVKGLEGGHSGIDIGLGRTNAIKVMAALLQEINDAGGALIQLSGGVKRNAIPPVATATVVVPEGQAWLQELAIRVTGRFQNPGDPGLVVTVEPGSPRARTAVHPDLLRQLVRLLQELPHGVLKTTPGSDDQPFVSINLALVNELEDDRLQIVLSGRSPSGVELDGLESQVRAIGTGCGAEYFCENGYPGWEPNYDSGLLATVKRVFPAAMGAEAKILEIHAGLECGIIGAKYPGMEMISIGPDLHYPHSPREHISIASVGRVYSLLQKLVAELQRS